LLFNDDRIGTYEFDLNAPYTGQYLFSTAKTSDGENYSGEFDVTETSPQSPPVSGAPTVGSPTYTNGAGTTFINSTTPISLSTDSTDVVHFQYRNRPEGGTLPTFSSSFPFPLHWTSTADQVGPVTAHVYLTGADGPQVLQFSAQTSGGVTEPRHTARFTLDSTPPVITINQPAATSYTHSQTLTLSYGADDGTGSGVKTVTALLDGAATTPAGQGLQSGQAISLLTSGLSLGPHTFTVNAVDNLGNASTKSVTFSIVVTPESIKEDVRLFLAAGKIDAGAANSLLAKLDAAAKAWTSGNCSTAANIYQAFINELKAQSGKQVDAAAAAIMTTDAQYLISHCP
jgi:hypothetical protein